MTVINQFNCVEDFLNHPSFRQWVLKTADADTFLFWDNWIKQHPGSEKMVFAAAAIIRNAGGETPSISEEEIAVEISKLQSAIITASATEQTTSQKSARISLSKWLQIAAVLIVIISTAAIFYIHTQATKKLQYISSYEHFKQSDKNVSLEFINNTDSSRTVLFPDGSKAVLSKGSRIVYINDSLAGYKNRSAYLQGEAFFSVTKNPAQPFVVYTNSIVTKVLGTSFIVKASDDSKATVIVKTGKVSVFKKHDFTTASLKPNELINGLIITPNQQALYEESSGLQKSIVEKPAVVAPEEPHPFTFDEAKLSDVFDELEEAYRINIVYDKETIATCSLTAKLGTEDFYDKLRIICKSVNASYEIVDGNIVITSGGCR